MWLDLEKLGLVFPKCRSKRKYGSVGFDYGTLVEENDDQEDDDDLDLKTGQGDEILSERDKLTIDTLNKQRVSQISLVYCFEMTSIDF